MRRSFVVILSAAAAVGITFTPAVASAGMHKQRPARHALAGHASSTAVTFGVTSADLMITVPPTEELVSATPGSVLSSAAGTVTIIDNFGLHTGTIDHSVL
jgi:hypothetical protein